jgi:hypothetical protein
MAHADEHPSQEPPEKPHEDEHAKPQERLRKETQDVAIERKLRERQRSP